MSRIKPVLKRLLDRLPEETSKRVEDAVNRLLNELKIEDIERKDDRLVIHYRDELGPGTAIYTEDWADSEPGTITALAVAIKAEEEGLIEPKEADTIATALQKTLALLPPQ